MSNLYYLILALIPALAVGGFFYYRRAGRRRPDLGARRESGLAQAALPVGSAIVICLAGWAVLSLLFTPSRPEKSEVKNVVTRPVAGQAEANKPAGPPEKKAPPSDKAGTRPRLVATSPLAKAALRASPVSSQLADVGDGLVCKAPPAKTSARSGGKAAAVSSAGPTARPKAKTVKARAGEELRFTVLLASFGVKENADRFLARLKAAGLPVYVRRVKVNSKTFYRVMAGRFPSRAQARAYGRELEVKGYTAETGPPKAWPLASGPDSG